jgi:hypothetical protein
MSFGVAALRFERKKYKGKKIRCYCGDLISLAEDRDKYSSVVNTGMNIQVP